MIVIVMGISGAGKTTVGRALAARLGCEFLDGDDWHPPENVAKMVAGTSLGDADRAPWLARLNAELRRRESEGKSVVLACSALKQAYRDRLAHGLQRCEFVFLHGSMELIRARMKTRRHPYMPESLLESQCAALEPPQRAIAVDVSADIAACVEAIERALRA